jgi:hypothetical protein
MVLALGVWITCEQAGLEDLQYPAPRVIPLPTPASSLNVALAHSDTKGHVVVNRLCSLIERVENSPPATEVMGTVHQQ